MGVRIHPTAEVSDKAKIGEGSSVWHHAQVREEVSIGENCIIGKGVYVDAGVAIGNNVKIQNNVSVYHGVTIEDGYIHIRGRAKRFAKIGGEMVSLVRTETVLEELLPSGVACCIVEVPDSIKGARIVAVVTEKVADKEIIRKMSHKLPAIAIPKTFIILPELPKMGSGKIDFRTVAQMAKANLEKR